MPMRATTPTAESGRMPLPAFSGAAAGHIGGMLERRRILSVSPD
jgi:hypothetical protein